MEERGSVNAFANDGSFMEMFRKKMEAERLRSRSSSSTDMTEASASAGCRSANEHDHVHGHEVNREVPPSSQAQRTGELVSDHVTSETPVKQANDTNLHTLSTAQTANAITAGLYTTEVEAGKEQSISVSFKTLTESERVPSESGTDKATNMAREQSTEDNSKTAATSVPTQKKYSLLSHVGKRRDGKLVLKTGTVKKQRTTDTGGNKDSWSKYMAEVQKYKAHVCGDEDKSRPLVK